MPGKVNCWDDRRCGRGPKGLLVAVLGPCPAATDTTCDGVNGGKNAGRLCWAVAGESCCDPATGAPVEKGKPCSTCRFFRRVKVEEGCHFQYGKPGLGSHDAAELHRRLNDVSTLMTVYQDVFASVAAKPLLARIAERLCAVTGASAAGAYLTGDAAELLLEAQAGVLPLRARLNLADGSPAAASLRSGVLWKGEASLDGFDGSAHVLAQPIGGDARLSGALVLVKTQGRFTADDEWFLWEFCLAAGLGLRNARLTQSVERLRRADRSQQQFIATMMHHLCSPLATVSLSLQALSQLWDRLDPADRFSLIDTSRERIRLIQTLTQQMLDLEAVRSGVHMANLRLVSPRDILCQEIEARQIQARSAGLEIILEGGDIAERVLADAGGLRLVYGNLLDNAIKYSAGKGKRIRVRLSAPADTVRVCISDQGIGIPQGEAASLFEKFRRGSNAADSRVPGSGLGLAIVKELVDRYAGTIGVASTVGEGTAFTVEFPIAVAEPEGTAPPHTASPAEPLAARTPAAKRHAGITDTDTGFLACYGCERCTAGCPTADRMDLKPHQVMRLLQLEQTEEVLAASGPWQCVGCQTCLARCPNAVDIPAVLARVREAQLGRGSPVGAGGIPDFDELFLDMVRRRGRVNDGLVAFRYRMRTGGLFDDWRLGLKMLKAGKMRLRVAPVIDRDGLARLFETEGEESE